MGGKRAIAGKVRDELTEPQQAAFDQLVSKNRGLCFNHLGRVAKGDVREASTIAAIQAVKDTPRMIPHCHPVPIESCKVRWHVEDTRLGCEVEVGAHYRTGIEMEALAGVTAGLLCAFDMVKSLEKDASGQYPVAQIDGVRVLEKHKGTA